jgi:hypothetical protein
MRWSDSKQPKPNPARRFAGLIILGAIVFFGYENLDRSADTAAHTPPAAATTPAASGSSAEASPVRGFGLPLGILIRDYRVDEAAADSHYAGRRVWVRGVVAAVGNAPPGMYVSLKDRLSAHRAVRCVFPTNARSSISRLTIGQELRVEGACVGRRRRSVVLEDCVIRLPLYPGQPNRS